MRLSLSVGAVVVAVGASCVAAVTAWAGGRGNEDGACCLPDGSCIFTNEETCQSQGGEFQGVDTLCQSQRGTPIVCIPVGACCTLDQGCVDDTTQEYCEGELGGLWEGSATFCAKGHLLALNSVGAAGSKIRGGIVCEASPPPNDDCENAFMIYSLGIPEYGTVSSATVDEIPNCEDSGTALLKNGVWYSVMGTGSVLQAQVCGDVQADRVPPRSVLFVYCGGCNNLQCVAGDGGNLVLCVGGDRTLDPVQWCSEFGREYLIFVALEDIITEDFILLVTDTEQPCKALTCGVPNDECDGAIHIESLGYVFGTTDGATPSDAPNCTNPTNVDMFAPDVWYSVTGTGFPMSAELCTGILDRGDLFGAIHVYCGGCGVLNCVAGVEGEVFNCDDDLRGDDELEVEWCSELGREYLIRVALLVHEPYYGEFALEVESDGKPCVPLSCGIADYCEDAQPVCPGIMYYGDTFSATNDYLDHGAPIETVFFCGMYFGLYDVWYSYTPTEPGLLFVHLEGPPTEYVYGVYDNCPLIGNLLACNITRHHSVIVTPVQPWHTYYIRIAGYGGSRGEYELDLLGPGCGTPDSGMHTLSQ